ncbi:MAG: DUF4783 domain-containing protein [Sphingobacteriaceae bacterium]|jgi:hypothetical protein
MKRFWILILLVFFTFTQVNAQNNIIDDISLGFANSDQQTIAKYIGNKVEINLFDLSSVYSKAQAEMVLKDFFAKYEVQSFQLFNKNNANGGPSKFAIGNLNTRNGNFRIFFILKEQEGAYFIQEMRFLAQASR